MEDFGWPSNFPKTSPLTFGPRHVKSQRRIWWRGGQELAKFIDAEDLATADDFRAI